ncbi:MAG TPA: MarR family winged helix-turn-helix transcriptional regulator [Casimicrobiaceae bacterium]|nr:MarR family winged helix-turn-helix transcriptional regulator [Casimicrobiaceae bacterium]
MTQLYDDALAPAQLSVSQFALLGTLARDGRSRISSLARALLLDRTALSRTLGPLVARRLVDVAPGADARTREVALTAGGRQALAAAQPHWRGVQARLAERIGSDRLDALYGVLQDLEALHPAEGR